MNCCVRCPQTTLQIYHNAHLVKIPALQERFPIAGNLLSSPVALCPALGDSIVKSRFQPTFVAINGSSSESNCVGVLTTRLATFLAEQPEKNLRLPLRGASPATCGAGFCPLRLPLSNNSPHSTARDSDDKERKETIVVGTNWPLCFHGVAGATARLLPRPCRICWSGPVTRESCEHASTQF